MRISRQRHSDANACVPVPISAKVAHGPRTSTVHEPAPCTHQHGRLTSSLAPSADEVRQDGRTLPSGDWQHLADTFRLAYRHQYRVEAFAATVLFRTIAPGPGATQDRWRNTCSQAAILRLGATREGLLRKHRVLPDGYIRDTVMYSVISEDWPSVRDRLRALLAAHE